MTDVKDLIQEERELYAQIVDLQERQGALRKLIQEEMELAKVEKIESGGYSLAIVRPKASEKLDRTLLVQAGVTPDQLKKGTTLVERAPYLSIRKMGDAGE
jgi:hypothetical protein